MMNITQEERDALKAILNCCIEQHETSGGDIDYAGFGDRSLQIMMDLLKKLED